MVSVLWYLIVSRWVHKITQAERLNHLAATVLRRANHAVAFFWVSLEGHLALTYIYPHFYFVLYAIHHYTGLPIDGFFYA